MSSLIKKKDDINFYLENHLEDIFFILKESIGLNQKVCLWVSGWSDSMLVAHLVYEFYIKRWYNTKNLYILHYNHHQREESNNDELFVKNWCKKKEVGFIWASYRWVWDTENELRKERWKFFHSVLGKTHKKPIFISGHHLSDRIETTILNLIRWCGKKWFYNMSLLRDCFYRDDLGDILQYVYLRPLIGMMKKEIISLCEYCDILFVVDKTNIDPNISQRNKLRWYLQEIWDDVYSVFDLIYSTHKKTGSVKLKSLKLFDIYVLEYYRIIDYCNIEDLQEVLEFIWEYKNISKWYLEELHGFIQDWVWKKVVWNRRLIKSHWDLYLVFAKKEFRETISVWWVMYIWKPHSKRYIKEKIPFFLRSKWLTHKMWYKENNLPRRRIFEINWYL